MEIAGRAAAHAAFEMWAEEPGHVAVMCGSGNNGGDGLVVARFLRLWGAPVSVYVVTADGGDVKMKTEESTANKTIAESLGIEISPLPEDLTLSLMNSTLIIDALLGTGLDRQVEGQYRVAIEAINRSGVPVLAVDLPSGINSDTGHTMGVSVRADRTITFGYLKPGLLQHPGASLAGEISVIDIGLPDIDAPDVVNLTTGDFVRGALPPRPENSNKGTFGSVLTIAGSACYFGAAILSSETALRTGAGLSTLAAPKTLVPHLPAKEVIYKLLPETDEISISSEAVKVLKPEIPKVSAVILGPGLSQNDDTVKFVQQILPVIAESGKGCIVDADGLNSISQDTSEFPKSAGNFVLTPHPKELSRLMQKSVEDIQKDRIASVKEAADKFGCAVVLKGSRTVVASEDGTVFINPTGNSGMATAGAGDVLSGIIGGLLAQGMKPFEAAVAGVYIHGVAGDIAAAELGETGIIAGDIAQAVPLAINEIERGEVSALEMQLNGEESFAAS
jgi:NAD(P)H-hydrate epimerase